MNVLFLSKSFGFGGISILTSVLANKFQSLGHHVSVYVFFKGNGATIEERFAKDVKLHVGNGFTVSPNNIKQLRDILINEQIDVVINQWGLPYIPIKVLTKAKQGLNIKVISVYHNDPSTNGRLKDVEISLSYTSNPLKRLFLKGKWEIWKLLTSHSIHYVYDHSDCYVVLSPSYIEHFKQFTRVKNTKKLVVPTYPVTLDASDFIFEITKKKKEILYVGRIDYNQKRVYRVIDTWALLEKRFPDWKLTIVGDGPERKNIEEQVRILNLEHVSFEGFQQPTAYYQRASILILTSEYEGFPLVLAECMSFGVIPAVYGSYTAVYDIIEDGKDGIILPFDKETGYEAQKMSERMVTVMDDPETLQSMAMQAVDKSKRYSLDAIGNSWSILLNKFSG